MIISDLTYLETATEANTLEGGIKLYELGTVFFQHTQAVDGMAVSGPMGSMVVAAVTDNLIFNSGGVKIKF